jgi:HK97 family phage major capsid protein
MPKDFNLEDVVEAVEAGNKAFDVFKAKNDEALAEIKAGYDDVVRRDELTRINDAMNSSQELNEKMAARMKRMALYGRHDDEGAGSHEREEKAYKWWAGVKGLNGRRVTRADFTDTEQAEVSGYKLAFENYMRHKGDDKLMSADDLKALSVGSDPDGGFVVDPDTSGRIIARIFESSPMRQYANVQSIGSDALEGLHDNDEASFGWVGETSARTETTTPKLEKWRIPVHEMFAKPSATQKLLDDASINMEAWLQGKITDKFSRAENDAFVNGSGVDKPRGFLTYPGRTSIEVFEIGAIGAYNTGANGAFSADPNGADVLIDALYGLKAQYRANAAFFMNRRTTSAVRKLKDGEGSYLWAPGLQAGQPASLLGYTQASFEDMPNLTVTGALAIAVGDMNAAYQVVDRIGVRVLRDPYSNKPFIEYYATKRTGGDMVNFEAIKLIKFAA